MKSILLLILCLLYSCFLQAQSNFELVFHPQFNGKDLQKDSVYVTAKGDSITIETLKLYVSGVRIVTRNHSNEVGVYKEANSFHLLDWEDSSSMKISLPNFPNQAIARELFFLLGIDSLTNVSGAMGGDLDPTKGMYWTWQNGYINAKIEGKSNSCKTRNHEFQFHIGGYQAPFDALIIVFFQTYAKKEVHIIIDLAKFFQDIALSKQNTVMSPGEEAVLLSEKLWNMFYIQKK